ncbi:PLP-dependent aminotransferase family protein [Klebsiella sp. BIGb0407]|uniref:aminotransferase-like domain-containing protein n=1 Tax=Klebsiella sp. BIGb0407 TaxID=2940603 RepID=UPI002169405E|nr:PLP-dependent aminotransferase family protein [Klebsiella sp. BIGb0407]MCS3429530.1 DNA-binding transcriptional MocR family regulator [Klebsiella sp. BIGb0407]
MHLYEQVAADIIRAISVGLLNAGGRIQSIREYAQAHNVSINTVKTAYRLLEDRGILTARPQAGYYVSATLPELRTVHNASVAGNTLPLSGISRLLSLILQNQQKGGYTDLALACPSGESFYPATRIRKLTSHVMRHSPYIQSTYVLPPGSERLRSQIARRGTHLGMLLSVEDILITHGTMEALNLAVRASTKPGDSVAVETPTFYNLYPMLEEMGRKAVAIPTHPQTGMCLDSLDEVLRKGGVSAVITIPSGHNPLGFTMPEENRRRLASMGHTYEIAIIEDAMYAELQFGPSPVPNIKAFDTDGWVMVCASYTKTVAPDFRIGWLEAGRFRDIARQMKFTSTVAEPALLTETLGLFLENGSYDLHLRFLKKRYNEQIEAVRALLSRHFPEGTRVSRPQCGFILWLELPGDIDTLDLFHAALDEKIICMPGLLCSGNKAFSHCLRLAVCFELTDQYVSGIRKLGELACRQLKQPLRRADDEVHI